MKRPIIGICGKAGSGKDALADMFVAHHGFVKVALADPMKRAVGDWFGWDFGKLWGASDERNAPDARYGGLTPRKALQFLGTEIGRELYKDVWVDYALRVAGQLLSGECAYTRMGGVDYGDASEPPVAVPGVVISDVRFANEVAALRKEGIVVRIKRPGAGLAGTAGNHQSELEQDTIPDSSFDAVINNNGPLGVLADVAAALLDMHLRKS